MNSQAGPPVSPRRPREGHDDEGAMMRNDEANRFRELLAAERRSADLYGASRKPRTASDGKY